MKKAVLAVVLSSLTLFLFACNNPGNDEKGSDSNRAEVESSNPVDHQGSVDEHQNTERSNSFNEDAIKKMEQLPYIEFELEVEYANDLEYEVELKRKHDGTVKAKVEDELNNVHLTGEDAFHYLYPLVEKMTVTKETTKEDAIQEALNIFNLPDDYIEFELEITFKDQTEIEFEEKR